MWGWTSLPLQMVLDSICNTWPDSRPKPMNESPTCWKEWRRSEVDIFFLFLSPLFLSSPTLSHQFSPLPRHVLFLSLLHTSLFHSPPFSRHFGLSTHKISLNSYFSMSLCGFLWSGKYFKDEMCNYLVNLCGFLWSRKQKYFRVLIILALWFIVGSNYEVCAKLENLCTSENLS